MAGIYDCKEKIKKVLMNDRDLTVKVLEEIGCHNIIKYFGENEIRCALPDGDTNTSVKVVLNEYMSSFVFSRSGFEDYKKYDIISLVMFVKKCKFDEAIKFLCSITGVTFDGEFIEYKEFNIIKSIEKQKKKITKKERIITHDKLNNGFLKMFSKKVINEWVEEGIPDFIQSKYNVLLDEKDMRYVIPIYDENWNLVTAKGRTYMPNYKQLGIPKYWYYKSIGAGNNDILYGLNFNLESIKQHNEIILFEGEKSVMKADYYGYDWSASVGKCGINPNLVKKILSLHIKNVVIAFDKDVEYKTVVKEAKKLSLFLNVYIIIDFDNLLGKRKIDGKDNKNAPVDCGKEVWKTLYDKKKKVN